MYAYNYKTLDVTGGQQKLTNFVMRTVRGPISQLYLLTVRGSNTCGCGI